MIKNQGVYTTKCPKCSRSIFVHLASDGSISPKKCSDCGLEFECIEYGEERNTFVIVAKTKQSKIEEKNKVDEKENTRLINITRVDKKEETKKGDHKTKRESFKIWKDN